MHMSWIKNSSSNKQLIKQLRARGRVLSRVLPPLSRQYCSHQPSQGSYLGKKSTSNSIEQVRSTSYLNQDDELASHSERTNEKGKRMRRNADEIERYYKCTVKSCAKSYGS